MNKIQLLLLTALVSMGITPSFALDAATDTAITTAFTAGQVSVGLATAGIVLLAAVMTGVFFVLKLLGK